MIASRGTSDRIVDIDGGVIATAQQAAAYGHITMACRPLGVSVGTDGVFFLLKKSPPNVGLLLTYYW